MADPQARIRPCDGSTDFVMWQMKMKAILIKEKCLKDVVETYSKDMSEEAKKDLDGIAHSEIIIKISDEVARQVTDCTTSTQL